MAIGEKKGFGYFDRYGGFHIVGKREEAEMYVTKIAIDKNPKGIIDYDGDFAVGFPLISDGKIGVVYNGGDDGLPEVELFRYRGGEGQSRSDIGNWPQAQQRQAKELLKGLGITLKG